MNICKSIALVGTLIVFSGCSMIDDSVLPKTRAFLGGSYGAIIEESDDGYVVVSHRVSGYSGEGSPVVAQGYCDKTSTTAHWEKIWYVDHREFNRYSCG